MHEKSSKKKRWDVGRLFRVKALPVYENKSRASTIAVVVNCLDTKNAKKLKVVNSASITRF